jgi:hypothetical protein
MTIYVLVTTCLIGIETEFERRKIQYKNAINKLKEYNKDGKFKIILIENQGQRETFLDDFGLPVFFTISNIIYHQKGWKEIKDIKECIYNFNIQDDDFIVKMTGRYLIQDDCEFFNKLKESTNNYTEEPKHDCIIRYGGNYKPASDVRIEDCITGLIGMRCKYVKDIALPGFYEDVEFCWARMSFNIPLEKICILTKLGIYISPLDCPFFLV